MRLGGRARPASGAPRLEPRFAACDQHCNACGQVCPTQAIRSLPLEEKIHARIGTAVIRKEQCLVWAQDKLCLICDEICPYNAIVFRTIDGYRRPVVVASRCNGCGFCEARCPVRGDSAIVVVADGEIRLAEGSYLTEAKRLQLDLTPDAGNDRFILEQSGLAERKAARDARGLLGVSESRRSRAAATRRFSISRCQRIADTWFPRFGAMRACRRRDTGCVATI